MPRGTDDDMALPAGGSTRKVDIRCCLYLLKSEAERHIPVGGTKHNAYIWIL